MVVRNILLILAVCAFCETYRTRRQTTTYKIDTKVVTDVEMYKRWSTYVRETSSETDVKKLDTQTQNMIQEYVSRCFHQANVRLATLNLGFTVQLQLVDIEFNYSAANANNINAEQTLNTFKDWLVKNSQSNLIDRYDHVMLFTSTALASVSSSGGEVQGLGHAYVGTMCKKDGTSSSVVEDKGGFQSSFPIAHEIAHSLGAQHDSFYPGCSDSTLYLMSGLASDPVSTRWIFSNCSANSIKTYINSILQSSSASCLTTSSTALNAFESTVGNNSGQDYPANQQCQMMYGKTSHVCYGANFSNVGDICTSMFCLDPVASKSSPTCTKHFAAEGTSCGDGKWCKLGICTVDSIAPVIGSCSLGDNVNKVKVNGIDLSCTQAVATAPHF
ncbi:metalloprotease mig-17-like [Physella acuta]|uniref:metalloprotease mig-17-like n=1 Tax=Physella acuta TaxID=109671 RepID=UPI0027DC7060|nr:metalloprotease mig-17-like [Physella acuta]